MAQCTNIFHITLYLAGDEKFKILTLEASNFLKWEQFLPCLNACPLSNLIFLYSSQPWFSPLMIFHLSGDITSDFTAFFSLLFSYHHRKSPFNRIY